MKKTIIVKLGKTNNLKDEYKTFVKKMDDNIKDFLFINKKATNGKIPLPAFRNTLGGLFPVAIVESMSKKSGPSNIVIDYQKQKDEILISKKTTDKATVDRYNEMPVKAVLESVANISPEKASQIFKKAIGEMNA